METYVIFRRNGWRTAEELQEATSRSRAEDDRMDEAVRWLRSYVIAENDGSLGTVCIYQAASPEAIRRHADAAILPIDEIRLLTAKVDVRPDPVETPA